MCPNCGGTTFSLAAGGNRIWQRVWCSTHLSVTADTVMQGSKVGLRRWFHAMCLMAMSKSGTSAMGLARQVSVSENTARYMMERIRGSMAISECPQRA